MVANLMLSSLLCKDLKLHRRHAVAEVKSFMYMKMAFSLDSIPRKALAFISMHHTSSQLQKV